jgi:WD40 repeat protein
MEKKEQTLPPTGPFADAKVLYKLPWSRDAITTVAFIDNRTVAAGNRRGNILVWNLTGPGVKETNPVRTLVGHTNEINRMLVTPDGKTLISASSDHTVKYWDAQSDQGESGKVVLNGILLKSVVPLNAKPPEEPEPIEAVVVVQKPVRELTGHNEWVHGLTQTPDGKILVTGDDRGVVIVWELPTGKEVRRWQADFWMRALGVSPDGKTIAASEYFAFRHPEKEKDSYRRFRLWDVETGKPKLDLSETLKDTMSAVRYSGDGKWLAVSVGNSGQEKPPGKVMLLDPATGKIVRELAPPHLVGATDLAFHPDGRHIFSSGRDQLVKIWRLEDGKYVRDFGKAKERGDWISAISISPDGHLLAAADMKGQIVVYSLSRSGA